MKLDDETRNAIWWAIEYRAAQLRADIERMKPRGWTASTEKYRAELVRLCDAQDLFVREK